MITISVETGKLPEQLERLGAAVRKGFWRQYGPAATLVLFREQRRHFSEQKSPAGAPWKPSKRAIRQHGMTLINTGLLRASVLGEGSGSVNRNGDLFCEIGTRVKYAGIHQFGGEINVSARRQTLLFRNVKGKGSRFASRKYAARRKSGSIRFATIIVGPHTIRIPARPFLGVSERGREDLRKMAKVKLNKVLREAAR